MNHIVYDAQTDTLTITLKHTAIDESRQVAPNLIVDYDAEGQTVGFELLDVRHYVQPQALTEESSPTADS